MNRWFAEQTLLLYRIHPLLFSLGWGTLHCTLSLATEKNCAQRFADRVRAVLLRGMGFSLKRAFVRTEFVRMGLLLFSGLQKDFLTGRDQDLALATYVV